MSAKQQRSGNNSGWERLPARHTIYPIQLPSIIDMDELALWSDEALVQRSNELEDDRMTVISARCNPIYWEFEIAYVRREQQIRHVRRERHEEYMRREAVANNAPTMFDPRTAVN